MEDQSHSLLKTLPILILMLGIVNFELQAQSPLGFGYADHALSINEAGEIFEGDSAIYENNQSLGEEGRAYKPEFGVIANRDSTIY